MGGGDLSQAQAIQRENRWGDGARENAVRWEDKGGDGGECSRSGKVRSTNEGSG